MLANSLLTVDTALDSIENLKDWIYRRNKEVTVKINRIPFNRMHGWLMEADGSLHHESGKFFSIIGIDVKTDFGSINHWRQPIILQPEIGYLGIITKEIDGVLYFLMQSKIEPGNINHVQISPTLQATKSNYSQIHKGNRPKYLEFFQKARPEQVILDQLQSEQGARFLKKRNRNIIIKVDEEVPVDDDFRWMTLGQIKSLMAYDNIVNMDTRTVISGLNIPEFMSKLDWRDNFSKMGRLYLQSALSEFPYQSMEEHLSWLTSLKAKYEMNISKCPVREMPQWIVSDDSIYREDGKYFEVIGVDVTISNREVKSWSQPLVKPMQTGLCAFIVKEIDGILHFLVQAKIECGNFDIVELAPTVQCLTGNVFDKLKKPHFVDFVLSAPKETIIYDSLQSEEGGRFYKEQNRNMIVRGDSLDIELPERYHWMTLNQLNMFMKFNNYLNIQARSLLSSLKYGNY